MLAFASSSPLQPIDPPSRTHPMVTRSQNQNFKPKQLYLAEIPCSEVEPTCVSQALKDHQWRQAMSEEFNALVSQGTWDLVPLAPNQNVIGCKWVFKLKRGKDGRVERYKARLVAKGFRQQPRTDYTQTFSLVIKLTTIRAILSIVVSKGWKIHQLDINNAFLHGKLDEQLFMQQPVRFIDPHLPHHVYDILITGSNLAAIDHLITAMSSKFLVKNLGELDFFLIVEAIQTSVGLFLSQQWYIQDILQRAGMENAKAVSTPLSSTTSLQKFSGYFNLYNCYVMYLGSNPVSWKATKQRAVARSSIEAKYRALAVASSEMVWILDLLHELGIHPSTPPVLYCDNIGATYLSNNLVMHSCMKHIAIDLHFVLRFFGARQLASSKGKLNALLPKALGTPRRLNDRAIAKDGRLITGPHSARALFDRNLQESVPSPGGGH
ncbi:hypothetical protein SLEP1_g55297 [Rubroshorea leprosula]|uniref:Reverse transcriptase Ty1/copia-type domain-containing protein n=1 Tax=Rubroshorea leprosula TaxID=152421 RepID=A0AAV5MEY5_9ROSI|nr:hypothetical protein SLEP1_g55297 [Rubroshorea leprosula]